MKKAQLQEECKARNLSKTGNMTALKKRLLDDDSANSTDDASTDVHESLLVTSKRLKISQNQNVQSLICHSCNQCTCPY